MPLLFCMDYNYWKKIQTLWLGFFPPLSSRFSNLGLHQWSKSYLSLLQIFPALSPHFRFPLIAHFTLLSTFGMLATLVILHILWQQLVEEKAWDCYPKLLHGNCGCRQSTASTTISWQMKSISKLCELPSQTKGELRKGELFALNDQTIATQRP